MKTGRRGVLVSAVALLTLVAGCAGAQQVADTPEQRSKSAATLARLLIESGSLDQSLDDGAGLAEESSVQAIELELGRQLTDSEKGHVRDILREVLAEFLTVEVWEQAVSEVCADHFTAPELETIIEFFRTPAGNKFLQNESVLAEDFDSRIGAQFEDRVDEFADRVDERLAETFDGLELEADR